MAHTPKQPEPAQARLASAEPDLEIAAPTPTAAPRGHPGLPGFPAAGRLSGPAVAQLQRSLGNRAVARVLSAPGQRQPAGGPPVRRLLENTAVNNALALGGLVDTVKAYATQLSQAVEDAYAMILTKYFVYIPAADGYMQALLDNFDVNTNKFIDGARMPRQAGYWIESYATKVLNPTPGGGIDRLLQAGRGKSRPDVVLQKGGVDLAWLDITSSASEGHIYQKDSAGWLATPYVTEVTYPGLSLLALNAVAVPDKSSKDLSALLKKAEEARQRTLDWEQAVIERYGLWFGSLLEQAYWHVKKNAVAKVDVMDDEAHDARFSPHIEGNDYQKLSTDLIGEKIGRAVAPEELAAVVMYMQAAVARYEKRFPPAQLPAIYKGITKADLGLAWVKNISSADGEPLIRDWFKV